MIVEDMYLIALELADHLADFGCEVIGPASSVKEAFARIEGIPFDGAELDVNPAGERSFPIAEYLSARGTPFLFLTGYDSVTVSPEKSQHFPRLSKPVVPKKLMRAVAESERMFSRRGVDCPASTDRGAN